MTKTVDLKNFLEENRLGEYLDRLQADGYEIQDLLESGDESLLELMGGKKAHLERLKRGLANLSANNSPTDSSNGLLELANELPMVLALPALEFLEQTTAPVLRLWALCDLVELSARLAVIVGIAEHGGKIPEKLRSKLLQKIVLPKLGDWLCMSRDVADNLPENPAFSGLRGFISHLNEELCPQGKSQEFKSSVLALRNRLAHGGGLNQKPARDILSAWEACSERLAEIFAPWGRFKMLSSSPDGGARLLQGVEPKIWEMPHEKKSGSLCGLIEERELNLWPLMTEVHGSEEILSGIYSRRGEVRLEYTPFSGDLAILEAEVPESFLEIFQRPSHKTPDAFHYQEFTSELQQEAARRIGRNEELSAVCSAIESLPLGGLLWVGGVAGMGKSCLMASATVAMLDSKPAQTLILPYRFKTGGGRCSVSDFLGYANERLQVCGGLDKDAAGKIAESASARTRFLELLRCVTAGWDVLIVADGLDELPTQDDKWLDEVVVASVRGKSSRTRWALAGRPERGIPQKLRKAGAAEVFPEGLPPMKAEDVRSFFFERLSRCKARNRLISRDAEKEGLIVNPFLREVMRRSEGLPIYMNFVIGDIINNKITPDQEGQLPQGIAAYHEELLRRCAVGDLQAVMTPLVAILALAHEPLGVPALASILRSAGRLDTDNINLVEKALAGVASMIRRAATPEGTDGYTLYHASLRQHVCTAESFRETIPQMRRSFSSFCAEAMNAGRKNLLPYIRRHGVEHFLETQDWDNATAALSDLEFIEARAIAQELPAMLGDYAEAVKLLPEGEKERQTEAARQGNLDRYAQEMYKYAAAWTRIRGGSSEPEPTLPRPVKSVRLWTEEEIAAERKRMTDTPNRLDIVKAFRVFVAINSAPLQQYSTQEGFAANLARNDAPAGPVHEEGKRRLEPLKCVKLIKHFAPEEIYNPLPACHAVLDGHTNRVFSLALSADGNRIVSGSSDKTLRVWDVKNGECLKIFQGHDYYSDFVLTGDGRRIVSGSSDKTLRVWDMQSGECLNIFDGHTDSVDMIRLTADDRLVVSGSSDNTLRMWNLGSGECLKVLQGHTGIVTSIALSADGRIAVSGSRDKTLRVWDLSSGECLKVLRGHASEVTSLSASLDFSLVVSQGWDKTLRVWDINSGECMHVLKGHQKPIIVSGLTQDMRRIVSLSEDMELRVWDLDTGNCKISYFNEEKGGDYYPISAVLNNNGKIFVFEKRTLRIWDIETSECLKVFEEPTGLIECLCISSDGKHIFSGSSEGTLRVWDMESGENHNIRERHHAEISSLSINIFEQRVISRARGDNKLRIWDLKSGKFIGLWPIDVGINGEPVALSANGRYIIAENKHAICVWDTETGQCINALIGHQGHVDKLSLTPDGRSVVSISWDKSLRVWNLSSGECINVLKSFQGNVDDIYISQDGCNIVSIDDKCTLRLWDLQTGCLLWTSDAKARKIALSPNGRQIIGVSGQLIQVINIKTGEILFDMEGHIRLVANAILTQDGNSVITISYDNTLRLWDIESGRCLSIFFKRGVAAIEFGNNQLPQIIIGSSNGDVEFYDIENLPLGPFITTAHRETLSKDLPAGSVAAQPACCGQQISIPTTIADQIEHWTHEGGEGGYTDPYLLLDCPNCGTPLRMNPFFVDINRNLQ